MPEVLPPSATVPDRLAAVVRLCDAMISAAAELRREASLGGSAAMPDPARMRALSDTLYRDASTAAIESSLACRAKSSFAGRPDAGPREGRPRDLRPPEA